MNASTDSAQPGVDLAALIGRVADLGLRIATAESLTGGMLASAIVTVPSASTVFSGGVVAYDTFLKQRLLGVDESLLQERGPVDGEVAKQMARGVRTSCAVTRGDEPSPCLADIGISTTGVAGPDPDPQTGQPPGTVWVGVSSPLGERAVSLHLEGGRTAIREACVRAALEELLDEIEQL